MAKNQIKWLTLFVLLLLTQGKLFAQLTANFTASPVSGCAPIVVHFTDSSTGNPTQWRWELGNGVTSILKNPSTTYFNPGTYTIKLVIKNSTGADSVVKKSYITVNPNPVVNLKASDTTGCFPLPVQFTDLSSTATGSINYWKWDFGDGTVAVDKNPQHTYNSSGNFTVTLRVSNDYGCFKTFSKTKYIKTSDGVKANFTNSTPGQCKAPVTINFTNASKGPGSLMYSWDFGDGTQSNELNPAHTYTATGSYTVRLLTVSPQGCRDTVTKTNLISIGTLIPKFTTSANVCVKQSITFSNTSTPSPGSMTWSFGDGTTSTDSTPVKTYTSAGTYMVKLVNNFGGCSDSLVRPVIVFTNPKANFSALDSVSCKLPFTVRFVNKSISGATYKWNFGDGTFSTDTTPVHTYTSPGRFTPILITFNENGCSDTLSRRQYIQIQKPSVSLNGLPQTGCNPITITPTATIKSNDIVTSYNWNFGNGDTSTVANPTYTYTTAGTYYVSLSITTKSGCSDSIKVSSAVRVGTKPVVKFSATPTDVCAMQPIQFTDNSSGSADQWYWDFGDGSNSVQKNPLHQYSDTGTFSVSLVAWNNTCPDTLLIKDYIHIKPPIASFSYTKDCAQKYKRNFTDKSIGVTTWFWDFGDGTTSTEQNPSHTYSNTGTYRVALNVSNGTCTNRSEQSIPVIDEKALFSADNKTICRNNSVTLTAININSSNIANWQWDFGDGTTATNAGTASHVYPANGTYTVSLKIKDILGCEDIKTDVITVYGPMANFNPNVVSACLGQSAIIFKDSSATDGVNAITKWVWNFGDGTADSTSSSSINHLYTQAGEFTVGMTVVDNFGCRDAITKPTAVIIAQPKALFISPDSLSCTGKPIHFMNNSTGYSLQYQWIFGDGTGSSDSNPVHNYSGIGLYPVGLTVIDKYGCQDSLNKGNYINISFPKAVLSVSDTFSTCPPLLAYFTNKSGNYTNLAWDFGDGNTSSLENPSHYYTTPGIFTARLIATGPGGCTDEATQQIEVRGPKGTFDYTPKIGCNPLTVNFTATTVNRVSFIWDYSDGTTISSKDSLIGHTYTNAGEYVPKMILVDATGCTVPVVGKDTIKVVGVTAQFTMDNSKICNTGTVAFTDASVSNDLITTYEWSFGDRVLSSNQNTAHDYNTPGVYPIRFVTTTQMGCTDTAYNNVNVFQGPSIKTWGDTTACVPAKINFKATVNQGDPQTLAWKWSFGNGQADTVQQPAAQQYDQIGNYTITTVATDINGCTDSTARAVAVNPLPATFAGGNTLLCRDSKLQLNATGATAYSWNPSPDLSCTTCANPVATPAESTTFYVTGSNQFGCVKEDSVKVRVRQHFTMTANPGDSICAGSTIHLGASGAENYTWTPGTGLDNTTTGRPIATPATTTLYTVIGRDNDNCFADTAKVMVKVNPVPSVDAGADVTTTAGTSIQLTTIYSNDVTTWKWTPSSTLSCGNCAAPKASPREKTKYFVEVKNAGGCVSSSDVTVSVICNNGNLFIPNTFSPNGDGTNDVFYPRGTGIAMVKALRIFDRWGELIYERTNFQANDPAMGWDGTYKGKKLTPDVYVYNCDVVCTNNEVLPFKGDVTLLR